LDRFRKIIIIIIIIDPHILVSENFSNPTYYILGEIPLNFEITQGKIFMLA